MVRKGFLLVAMEPPPALEEEFNDWYDTEHVPERLAVPGFETATRYVCTSGWPRYLAFYDLEHAGVLDSPAYQAIAGDNFSPWTRRILARARGFYRAGGEQLFPGASLRRPSTRLVLVRFRGVAVPAIDELAQTVRREFAQREAVVQLRVFRDLIACSDDLIVTVELSAPCYDVGSAVRGCGAFAAHAAMINEYVPYVGCA